MKFMSRNTAVQSVFKESVLCVAPSFGSAFLIKPIIKWDQRLLTLDPLSVAHVLKNSTIYEKPWQSRRLITSLIGCGMLAAEGQVHKRQRRVATAAFSVQNMRALVPIAFKKGTELRDTWLDILRRNDTQSYRIDVCHWISRATFDVIGLAGLCLLDSIVIALTELFQGFDYNFNAIKNESNELFAAYKEMFEIAISQSHPVWTMLRIYVPFMSALLASSFFSR
jgi:cytochrome P450